MAAHHFQQTKKAYLEEEARLHALLCDKKFQASFQSWLDDTIAQLDTKYEHCEGRLAELQQTVAVDSGDYWNAKTLAQHCNLNVDVRRLVAKDAPVTAAPSWPDAIRLIAALNSLKSKGFISPKQVKFLELVEAELRNVVFEPRELGYITNALSLKLSDATQSQSIFSELAAYQNAIDELAPDLDACEQLLEAALMNGDMAIAEDISYRQLDMYEHMLRLCNEQYPIIRQRHTEAEESHRRRRWAIFRMANKDISCVIEAKFRQIEACEDDLNRIKEQLENYSNDDIHQRKRYELDKRESDKYLAENKTKQQSVWNRIYDLFQELTNAQSELEKLGQLRRKEVERRLRLEEREAGRRSGHQAFVKACSEHAQRLQDTIDNALAAKDIAKALNDFVLDGCDTVTAKYDRQQEALGEMMTLVRHHHFKRYTDMYIAASRLLYRKEKRMDQLNAEIDQSTIAKEVASETFDPIAKKYADNIAALLRKKTVLAEEILNLRHRIDLADQDVAPTLRAFESNGTPFVHPSEIAEKINFDRAERVLDYREMVNPSIAKSDVLLRDEETTFEQKRAEITQSSQQRRTPRPPRQAITGGGGGLASSSTPSGRASQYQRFQELVEKKLTTPSEAATAAARERDERNEASARPTAPARGIAEGETLRALYRYAATAADELTFEKGDIIICVGPAQEEGWFHGVCNQKSGLFPANYVSPVAS